MTLRRRRLGLSHKVLIFPATPMPGSHILRRRCDDGKATVESLAARSLNHTTLIAAQV